MAYDMKRPVAATYYHKPRGSGKVKDIYSLDAGTKRRPRVADAEVKFRFAICEPLCFCVCDALLYLALAM